MTRMGACLCGAVRFAIEADASEVAVCHCGMCRRWTGGPFAGIHVKGAVAFEGREAIGLYRGSSWGERGFCKICGSTLFWRLQDQSETVLPAGAFDDASGFKLTTEIFIDEKPDFYDFAQETKKMTGAEAFAAFAPPSDDQGSGDPS